MLLDTGPLVALLDSRDAWHERVLDAWPELVERCVTTEPVITEGTHLVGRGGAEPWRVLEYVLAAGIPVVPLPVAALRQAASLMRQYANLPMDFADATLVAMGDALGVSTTFTTDRRGFSAYRGARGLAFTLVP